MSEASDDDLEACRRILASGSKSFAMASRLLPRRVRIHATALYAFCRVADDAVDIEKDPRASLARMRSRLDDLYRGEPRDSPIDRALCRAVAQFTLPRVAFDALLEGFEWDLEERQYETLSDVLSYAARVASSVGVLMSALMEARSSEALARASELGLAMQLTNIARDVGEDARKGRLYLPSIWLREEGLDRASFLASPSPSPELARVVARLIDAADHLYQRADLGVQLLTRDCRVAIRAARLIYSDIHRAIALRDYDVVNHRAVVSRGRKIWLLAAAAGTSLAPAWRAESAKAQALPPVDEVRFLVEAGARQS